MSFTLHTKETASEQSQPLLDNAIEAFGMVPNLIAVMAEAPATLEAYQTLHSLFQQTSFDAEELTVVWQTINVEHECHYCVPAHTAIAHMMKVDAGIIDALRNKTDLPTEKLQVLRRTTLALVKNRGRLASSDVQAFKTVGYENKQLLEIVLGISQKVISNYTNHLAETPLDEPFKQFA
ncbi:carboxymuconolactone decarboxylase family protein [uncultured Kiloniella sp.]|uniref:carboxymuconolactone decarboxylase family protein n=1 Tax=uncultured Kiloniella sp. TaxID=1133091 RepID=UPI00262279C2|nr:carboxymuconolactone decarboxylase family protein [uncultured Kiloniella sp.]